MKQVKIIELDKRFIQFIFIAFLISVAFVFIVNFIWGEIQAMPGGPNYSSSILYFDYYTAFGNFLRVEDFTGYDVGVFTFGGSYVKEHYFLKFNFAARSLFVDYKIILWGTVVLSLIKYILSVIKFKFK